MKSIGPLATANWRLAIVSVLAVALLAMAFPYAIGALLWLDGYPFAFLLEAVVATATLVYAVRQVRRAKRLRAPDRPPNPWPGIGLLAAVYGAFTIAVVGGIGAWAHPTRAQRASVVHKIFTSPPLDVQINGD